MKKLSDPIESRIECYYSQQLSDDTQVQNYKDIICPKDDFKKSNYIQKKFGFDGSYSLILLSLMYKDIWFYCYSEEKNDLNIYKFNHKVINQLSRGVIYIPQFDINVVCVYYKIVIRDTSNL